MPFSSIPTCTKGSLYLGSSACINYLKILKIGLVISLYPLKITDTSIKQYYYEISDSPIEYLRMNSILDETREDINDALMNGINVMVHCFAGISRSSTVVLDFLLSTELLYMTNYDDVLAYIRKFRPQVNPNHGFKKLLKLKYNLV